MVNLLPNLEIFLGEMRKLPQVVEGISEKYGFIFIELKYPEFADPDIGASFMRLVFSLSKKLQLKPYLKVVSEPRKYKLPVAVSSETTLYVSIGAIHAEKLKGNYDAFLAEIKNQDIVESVSPEKDGKIAILLKKGIRHNPDKIALIFSTAQKFMIYNFIRLDNNAADTYTADVVLPSPAALSLDVASLHTDRLKDHFQKDLYKDEIGDSLKYLQNLGWSKKDFSELGISKATFFRYRSPDTKGGEEATS
jgi:hypothetical protein